MSAAVGGGGGEECFISCPRLLARIMRLCDKRYAGVAVGVGQGKIVGRIHNVQLKVPTPHPPRG